MSTSKKWSWEVSRCVNMINGINGWIFEQSVIEEANRNGKMLTMDFELGSACPLRCIYCYRSGDSRDEGKDLISFDEWKRVVDEAKALGVKSIKLIGGGEITQEKRFVEAVKYIADKGITIVLFMSGTVLGDDKLCRKIHGMSSRELAKFMYDIGMSVFMKMDSLDEKLQDSIAGMKGYAKIRNRALKLLLELDFNKHDPTRLGLEVNVNRYNIHEIMKIYSLRVKYNLYEDVVISMPCDAYYRNKDYDISLQQKKELYRQIYNLNKEHGIPFSGISPFIGGLVCSQLGNGLYVTNRGDVYHCPGAFDCIGNVRAEPLKVIWQRFAESKKYHDKYFCPFREHAKIIPANLVKELGHELIANQ